MLDAMLDHECDLFLLSSHHPYSADRSLPEFARQGNSYIHGWGIGSYSDGKAHDLRSAERAFEGGREASGLSREFEVAVRAAASPVILGHLRLTSRGQVRVENNHPFRLAFLGYEWLLIHNGTATHPDRLVSSEQRLLRNSDTPRVFEYLRGRVVEYCQRSPRKSLIEACRFAFGSLLDADPSGKFNLILSNGHLSFVLVHWREFYLLNRPNIMDPEN